MIILGSRDDVLLTFDPSNALHPVGWSGGGGHSAHRRLPHPEVPAGPARGWKWRTTGCDESIHEDGRWGLGIVCMIELGPCLNIKTQACFFSMWKIRRSWERLIFNMGIPILVRHLYIETAPRFAMSTALKCFDIDLWMWLYEVPLMEQKYVINAIFAWWYQSPVSWYLAGRNTHHPYILVNT